MNQNTLIIAPKADKKFLIAKVLGIQVDENKKSQIKIPAGYDLYWSCDKDGLEKFDLPDGNILGNQIPIESLFNTDKKRYKSATLINLFWIKNDDLTISVGWGCRKGDYGINGKMQLKITNIETFIPICKTIWWKTELDGGFTYEYLSEFYIGADNKPRGLVRELSQKFLPAINTAISNLTEVTAAAVINVVKYVMEQEPICNLSLSYIETTCNIVV